MRGKMDRCDWTAYFQAAYEEERKQNTALAGRIADAERRQADAWDSLNRLCENPLYRLAVKMLSPLRDAARRLKRGRSQMSDFLQMEAGKERRLAYEEELWRQKNPYLQWIAQCENTGVVSSGEPIPVRGFREIAVPGTDATLFTYGEGLLSWNAFGAVKAYFAAHPACLLAYADEDFYWEDLEKRMEPWWKPDYSPDTLLAFPYFGHLLAVRTSLLDDKRYRMISKKETDAGFYELCLRLEEKVTELVGESLPARREAIGHLEALLYHRAYRPSRVCEARLAREADPRRRFLLAQESLRQELAAGRLYAGAEPSCLPVREDALMRRGLRASFQQGADPGIFHLVYDTSVSGRERCTRSGSENVAIAPHRVVSVVIPSKDHPEVLENCLRSFREKTAYRYYEWIVVDNGSSAENREKMEALQKNYGFTYLYEPMPFHFSKMCNLGVQKAKGDLLLLMNDDMEVIEGSWLSRMAGQAIQPHVGAVGAKLWYAGTEKIQHAGVTNLKIGPSHKLVTFPDDQDYYYGRNRFTHNVSAVTAACLMVARKKYQEVGGLPEELPIAYNDVAFCFRLLEAGYANVQRNDVILWHHESLSRGLDEESGGKWERLLAEKETLFERHPQFRGRDPFYHKDLIDNASNYICNYKFPHQDSLATRQPRFLPKSILRRQLRKAGAGSLMLTVDRAELQHKIYADEPDILWIMGWSYLPDADNAGFRREILLQRADGAGYLAAPVDWHRVDVEEILPGERNVGLAGFALRLLCADISPGDYRVGMIAAWDGERAETQELPSWFAWSEKRVQIIDKTES